MGILETIGPEIRNGVVASAYLDERKLYSAMPRPDMKFANLTSRRAIKFHVTNELSTMTPYAVPQKWAQDLDKIVSGVSYRSRFDLGSSTRAVALFGPAGLSTRASGRGREVSQTLRRRLEKECGIKVAGPPRLSELEVNPPFTAL